VSPVQQDNAVWINQDAKFSLATLDAGKELNYKNAFAGNGVYFFILDGKITIADKELNKRDALGIYEVNDVILKAVDKTSLLAIEVPML
ncbi:MAG TPA: hypothetical protein VKI61_08650, partial [Chitinophagaceae bacterium]|nr:hypothetical protein [Chitinophagaceae bacterium]